MDAHLTSPTSFHADSIDDPLSRIAKQALALGAALVLVLCVVIVVRGLLGAFEAPASASFLMLAAVTAELLASVFRIVWLRLYPDATRRSALCVRLGVPSISIICLAVALSMAAASGWAVGWLWLIVAGGEVAWWYPALRSARHRNSERVTAASVEPFDERAAIGADIIQQMTRSRNSDGIDVISGVLRAEFSSGERTHNLHVAFCPPLAYEPAVITYQLDGSPLTIKVAQSEVFGTRIELRRAADASTSERATICFEVQPH